MALEDILKKVSGRGSDIYGTKQESFDKRMAEIVEIWLLKKGKKIDKSVAFDKNMVNSLILAKDLVILKDVKEFTPSSEENVKKTYGSGKKSVSRLGLYEFTATFESGVGFFKSLHALTGSGWDVAFVDAENTLYLQEGSDYVKGYSTTYVSAEPTVFNNGTDPAYKPLMFQLRDSRGFDMNYTFVEGDELEVSYVDDITPIRELTYDISTVPSDGDTTVDVLVKSSVNTSEDMASLLGTNTDIVKVNVNGVDVAVSSVVNSATDILTVTVPSFSTGDKVYVYADPFLTTDNGIFQAKDTAIETV